MSLASTGHDNQNVTVALTASADGNKRLLFIVFRGKRKTSKDKQLAARRDIVVAFSDSGWFNTPLTIDWLQRVMASILERAQLVLWLLWRVQKNWYIPLYGFVWAEPEPS